jgi:hypothetical protein
MLVDGMLPPMHTPTALVDRLRPVWVGLSVVLLAVAVWIWYSLYLIIDGQQSVGVDLEYYRFVAQRWLDTGIYYTTDQLSGPYETETLVTNLYPPHALYLFVPFLFLPSVLWWILPLAFIVYVVWWCRPAIWAWPILLAIVVFPKTPNQIIYGNTDMWIAAFIAGGVRFGWPSTLVSIKPSLIFFAAIGILRRSWWIAVAVLAVASLPFLALWLDYPTVLLNSSGTVAYSFGNLPFFLLPIVAWLVSGRRGRVSIVDWSLQLLRGSRPERG